jgi:hypothetical protein
MHGLFVAPQNYLGKKLHFALFTLDMGLGVQVLFNSHSLAISRLRTITAGMSQRGYIDV